MSFVSLQPSPESCLVSMPRRAESGRASLEFLVAAVILMIPILMLTVSLWSLQRAQFATEAAARHAVRVYALHTSSAQAATASYRAVAHTLRQWGVEEAFDARMRCSAACLDPGSWVEISVVVNVPVGAIPPVFAADGFVVPIASSSTARISVYRGDP